jgi:hypothetical protein
MRKIILPLIFPLVVYSQATDDKDFWRDFEFLIGEWAATESGRMGEGRGERKIELVLQNKYLYWKNKSTFEPQEKNSKGEVHEDWALISFDKIRKKFVMRQFHVEGFVNQYVLESVSSDMKKLIFLSESIENVPAGFKAKLTYEIISENEFIEYFELAPPRKEFTLYTTNHWRKR